MASNLQLASLLTIPISFASVSIGCKDDHNLPRKIEALAEAEILGIELGMPDLLSFASLHLRKEVGPYDFDDLCTAANAVKAMCDAKRMQIMLLQPFSNYEGWPEGSEGKVDARKRAEGWIRVMEACGCDTLQVGSSDTPADEANFNRSHVVADLRELADKLAKHGFRLAYENWCWSSHAPDWRDVWEIVQAVDRPNVGLCLDTFQTAGGEWADPSTASGLLEDVPKEELETRFQKSLDDLSSTIPKDKIYLLQISDAYKLSKPITKDDKTGLRPRGQWSHDYRPLPYNGGYLPVVDVCKAVLRTGFRGWFSYEVFDGGPDGKGKDYELNVFATSAKISHKKLIEGCAEE